ncbi:phage integrase family protein [Photobacterium leiognathi lrivu.4.1]|uniref:Phage integrase family protein n=1 Tax=Photobacterium leiognathi lrivu.4.1 TaxID=1248232 RepID=X0NXS7_PHOLE|nr:site-specific integrase [Photobacterium leiognathi]GAD29025.1 phage integrase family protein [Photobacterium leiognathi lrivu.4.1]
MDYVIWVLPSLKIDQTFTRCTDRDTGEIKFRWGGKPNIINNMPLLFEDTGTPVSIVNNWLIYLKSTKYRKQVNTQAQALLHYFYFLDKLNIKWDEMPIISRHKPTYQFSRHLQDSVKSGNLARSTANNYLGSVVNFYKFYLARGYQFTNPPFNYEIAKVRLEGNHEYMRDKFIYVNTTDIRLNLPKNTSFGGVSRALIPLSDREWALVDDVCRVKSKVISNQDDKSISVKISQEYRLTIALARYTGLRREELTTFRSKFVYKPSSEQLKSKYLIHTDGVLISPKFGVNTKGSGSRTIEMPSELMMILHKYINSYRYIKRRKLFELNYPDEMDNPPLLITQTGHYYAPHTFNARWGEVRNTVRNSIPQFDHKFHNLRSTYAVSRIKELLNKGVKEGDALDYIQSVMGHKSRTTLLHYLKFCNEDIGANATFEQALEILLKD